PAPTPPIAGSRGGRLAGQHGSPTPCRRPRTRPAMRLALPRALAALAPTARRRSRRSAPSRRPSARGVCPPLTHGGSRAGGRVLDCEEIGEARSVLRFKACLPLVR